MTALAYAPNGAHKPLLSNVIDEWFGNNLRGRFLSSQPSTNIIELDDQYLVQLAVPGYRKEDFTIDIDHGMLKISTTLSSDETGATEEYKLQEFSLGAFTKSIMIPDTVDEDQITASCKEGILTIKLPKKDEAKKQPPRRIDIS